MTPEERYMSVALQEAREALAEGEIPIGAVIVCRDRVISKGHNMTERLHDPTAHAEMIAITAACEALGGKYLSDCTLYVTVEPCPMCAAAMNWAQIGCVVWGADDPKRGFSLFSADSSVTGGDAQEGRKSLLHPKTQRASGILSDECSALMTDFFKSKRQ